MSELATILAQAAVQPPANPPLGLPQGVLPPDSVHTIVAGPEYDKWDEALAQHGRIRLPKELDNPQTWLGLDHIKAFLDQNAVDREDQPDGSVILSRKVPTS